MKPEDAEEFTQALGQSAGGLWRQIALAKKLGVPKALGLKTEEWVEKRLGGYINLSIADRREAVRELALDHSNRAIAEVLGVDESTIREDHRAGNPAARDEKRNENNAALNVIAGNPAPALCGQYATIVVDPPWPMEKIEREVRPNQVGFDYPTMSERDLVNFPLADITADDCHVFQWTTQKYLPTALKLFGVWGVRYVVTMVWHKPGGFQPVGLPQYNCEFVLYGRRGSPEFLDTKAFNCCFEAPRREHSRKPDEFYDLIRRVAPQPRIDVFSREPRQGFEQWGNEPQRFCEVAE